MEKLRRVLREIPKAHQGALALLSPEERERVKFADRLAQYTNGTRPSQLARRARELAGR